MDLEKDGWVGVGGVCVIFLLIVLIFMMNLERNLLIERERKWEEVLGGRFEWKVEVVK